MPIIYLSPSMQPYNEYISGGNEQYYMNLLADAMEPYLITNGIQFNRNPIDSTLRKAINESNARNYDLHLALHSNSSPPELSGVLQGPDVYYNPYSYIGEAAAEIIAENLKNIYPNPDKVNALSSTTINELKLTKAPAVLIETAYHDNLEDEAWIKDNLDSIASNIVESLTYFFEIPFISEPFTPTTGYVNTSYGSLNLRRKPSYNSPIITKIPKDSEIVILGKWNDWYVASYNGNTGYVSANYVLI